MRKFAAIVGAGFLLVLSAAPVGLAAAPPKNVIFFIGDGMGPEQVLAANYYNGGDLSFEAFTYQGFLTTYSANSPVHGLGGRRDGPSHRHKGQ